MKKHYKKDSVAMEDWIRRLHELLESQGIQVHILTKYVDDVLRVVGSVELGTRWSIDGLTVTKEDQADNIRNHRTSQKVTL